MTTVTLDLEDPKDVASLKARLGLDTCSGTLPLAPIPQPPSTDPLRLDLGCGTRKKEGFKGVDSRAFPGVDVVCNLGRDPWPWADGSVDEVHCSHMVEHLNATERIHFVNELHRVMKPGAKAQVITPHWNSTRAYGDLTHQWPPVSEFWFYYLSAKWRSENAPHNDFYTCDFDATWSYSLHPSLHVKPQAYVQEAVAWWKEAVQDIIATLVKKEPAK